MEKKKVFLLPGEVYFSKEPTLVSTVLGSCVAFCIFDRRQKVGGINHYQLPGKIHGEEDGDTKFALSALKKLLAGLKNECGSRLQDLEVKILGGSSVYSKMGDPFPVGDKNIEIAHKLEKKFNLNVIGASVGGKRGRKLEYDTSTGNIRFKMIEKTEYDKEERENNNKSLVLGKVRVLAVDDSPVILALFKKIIDEFDDVELVGTALDPIEAMAFRKKNEIDVITLDVNMPKMDGVTYLKQYIKKDPKPTIMISDLSKDDSGIVLDALESGAFDYLKKPSMENIIEFKKDLHDKLVAASKSVKTKDSSKVERVTGLGGQLKASITGRHLLAFGSSTGGTEALKSVLTAMPKHIPPTVIVQHIPPVFSKNFADRLNELCPFHVKEAENRDYLEADTVYVAPGGQQMKVTQDGGRLRIKITDDAPVNRFKPSVDYLFNSIAELKNKKVVAVIMTGMGNDGAKGMLRLKNKGAKTLGQDEKSCIVYGMPKEAKLLGGVDQEVSLARLPQGICNAIIKI